MAYVVVSGAPEAELVSLADMKNYLRVEDITEDDDLITGLIKAAREYAETYTGKSLVKKLYTQYLDSFPYFTDTVMSQMAYPPSYYALPRYSTTLWNYSQMIKLFRSPLEQITKITYTDSASGQILSALPALFNWMPLTEYTIGEQIEDSNGNLQVVTAVSGDDEDGTSISGASAPTWATTVGQPTTDGMITWTCMGQADAGDFIYDADSNPPRLFPLAGQFWPSVLYVPNAVQIHYIAGYGNTGAAVPAGIRTAMRQLVCDWYYNREPVTSGTVSELPNHVKSLLWAHRVLDLAPTRG